MIKAYEACLDSSVFCAEGNGSESRSILGQRRVSWATCGIGSLAAVATLALWIAIDPAMAVADNSLAGSFLYSCTSFCRHVLELEGLRRIVMFALLGCSLALSLVWIALMLIGQASDRSFRSFLAFTGMFAIWLACIGAWNEIAWTGKQWRAIRYVSAFEPIAAELKSNWPRLSGEQRLVGLYMSYPTHRPQSMILMACPTIPKCPVSFNGIERTPDGGIAFAMIGSDRGNGDDGDWLEWHPAGHEPKSFLTGLHQNKKLHRTADLAQGWFLVRYAP